MTLTEMYMLEASSPWNASEKNKQCSVPACEASSGRKLPDMVAKEKYGSRETRKTTWGHRCWERKQCSNCSECGEKRQRRKKGRMWHVREIEEKPCTPGVELTTGPLQDERGNVPLQTVEKTCVLRPGAVADREAGVKGMPPPSILLLIIYLSSKYTCDVKLKKRVPFLN